MNLKCSGFLFVLTLTLEAISGSGSNSTSVSQNRAQSSEAQPVPEKSQAENVQTEATTESVKVIIPNTAELISKLSVNESITKKTTPDSNSDTTTTTTPAPNTFPERGSWVVRNETSNITCVIAEMAMQLNITYLSPEESLKNAILNVPKDAKASGNCSTNTSTPQTLKISWGFGHSIMINFKANKTANNFFISEMSLSVNATAFGGGVNETLNFKNSSSEFMTPLDMSYKCNEVQGINLDSKDPKIKAVLSLKETQFEAYMNKTKPDFGEAQDCDSFDTPDIVPIAVGCALAILVLVVLVAYLIGRKRSQNRGYLSM